MCFLFAEFLREKSFGRKIKLSEHLAWRITAVRAVLFRYDVFTGWNRYLRISFHMYNCKQPQRNGDCSDTFSHKETSAESFAYRIGYLTAGDNSTFAFQKLCVKRDRFGSHDHCFRQRMMNVVWYKLINVRCKYLYTALSAVKNCFFYVYAESRYRFGANIRRRVSVNGNLEIKLL